MPTSQREATTERKYKISGNVDNSNITAKVISDADSDELRVIRLMRHFNGSTPRPPQGFVDIYPEDLDDMISLLEEFRE